MLDAAPVTGQPAQVVELSAGVARVELHGELPLGWCGNLAAALSQRGVSIVRGNAERQGTGWSVVLEVQAEEGVDPRELDFATLAAETSRESHGAPRLESFVLTLPRRRSAAVELTVRGADRRGFLAALLEKLAALGLFPERISVETVNTMAADTLWLQGVGGQPPTDRSIEALREFLRGVTSSG
jgi:predicted amino acid-binding ACT domain protein